MKALSKQWCHDEGAEMPGFECFNMWVKTPKAYFVFYVHLLKRAAGQTCRKENLKDGADGNLEPFATPNVQEFTLLCAWRITNRIGCMKPWLYNETSK
jgi:hypothetical protein